MSHLFEGVCVSMFTNAKATAPTETSLANVLGEIREGTYADQTRVARDLFSKWKQTPGGTSDKKSPEAAAYAAHKKKLPAFTVSGTFTKRKATALKVHSGFLQVDLDKLGGELEAVRDKLKTDPHVAFGFISPSGEGLKLGLLIDSTRHLESFHAAQAYFHNTHNLSIDPACKDVSRLCFVSHDPALWINANATPIPLGVSGRTNPNKHFQANGKDTELCRDADMQLRSMQNAELRRMSGGAAAEILQNIKAKKTAFAKLESIQQGLSTLYVQLVEKRYPAVEGRRNHFITQAVPFLYRAVSPDIAKEFALRFYDCNHAHFDDPPEQHLKETEAMIQNAITTYRESLGAQEREIYDELENHEQATFRICRDLAFRPEPEREPRTFFLSFGQLGLRLGIHGIQAQSIMQRLEHYGLVRLHKKGTRREKGIRAQATTWEWLLPTNGDWSTN